MILDSDIVITGGCEAVHPDRRGGQHVAKPCTGVRATHRPTGISVMVDTERSQHANRRLAEKRLKATVEAATDTVNVDVAGCLSCNGEAVRSYLIARGVDPARFVVVPEPTRAWSDILPCEACGVFWLVKP